MLYLCRPALYRAGTGWHGNTIKKTAFRRAGPNFQRPLLRVICFFLRRLKQGLQYTARRINSRSIRPNGRDVRAVGLLQNSARDQK